MALTIGLTGSIASGKTTISLKFADYQIPVVDADKIAHDVVNPGEKAYQQIIETFGSEILNEDQSIDRKALGAIVFADESKRSQLNAIVHPAVREKMLSERDSWINEGVKCVVLDIPLLFESNLVHFVDKTLVVFVDESVQLTRLMDRDQYTKDEALQRIKSQMPVQKKADMADAVINNNGTKHQSCEQLKQILAEWHAV